MKVKNGFYMQNNAWWNIQDALVVDDWHQVIGLYKHLIGLIENMVKNAVIGKQYQAIPTFRQLKSFDICFLSTGLINPAYTELGAHMCQLLTTVHNIIPL